jgi:hypothetical protein
MQGACRRWVLETKQSKESNHTVTAGHGGATSMEVKDEWALMQGRGLHLIKGVLLHVG